jgi:hypothetical protein
MRIVPQDCSRDLGPIIQSSIHTTRKDKGMWKMLRELLRRAWHTLNRGAATRRAEEDRERFWAEVRVGQQEAEDENRD